MKSGAPDTGTGNRGFSLRASYLIESAHFGANGPGVDANTTRGSNTANRREDRLITQERVFQVARKGFRTSWTHGCIFRLNCLGAKVHSEPTVDESILTDATKNGSASDQY